MKYTINYESSPDQNILKILWEGLTEHAKETKGHEPSKSYAFSIQDEINQIMGGCSGYMFYGCLYIELLWIDKTLRGQGYGLKLVAKAEELGVSNKCLFVAVNTMDWEAIGFYQKLGYCIEFERQGFAKNSISYFLRKKLPTVNVVIK